MNNDSFCDVPFATKQAVAPKLLPPYHVIILDDNDHTYAYVISMLGKLFRMPVEEAYKICDEIDNSGRAIIWTGPKETAEFHQEHIHSMGADQRLERSVGCMTAVIEPAV